MWWFDVVPYCTWSLKIPKSPVINNVITWTHISAMQAMEEETILEKITNITSKEDIDKFALEFNRSNKILDIKFLAVFFDKFIEVTHYHYWIHFSITHYYLEHFFWKTEWNNNLTREESKMVNDFKYWLYKKHEIDQTKLEKFKLEEKEIIEEIEKIDWPEDLIWFINRNKWKNLSSEVYEKLYNKIKFKIINLDYVSVSSTMSILFWDEISNYFLDNNKLKYDKNNKIRIFDKDWITLLEEPENID